MMKGPSEDFFIFVLTFILIYFKEVTPSAVVLPIENYRMPCVSIEYALNIVRVRNSPPSILDMSFKIDMDEAYRQRYGPTSNSQDRHSETYNCAMKIEPEISGIVDNFLNRVIELLKLRREAFVSDGQNFEPKAQRTNRQSGQPSSEGVDLESKDDPSENFKTKQMISKLEKSLPFVYNKTWLEKRLQDDLYRGTDVNEINKMAEKSDRRTKREPMTLIAILLSIASLSATTATGLYLGARLEKLVDYIDELTEVVNQDWQNLKISVNDLTMLRDSFGSVCAGAQYLQNSIRQLVKKNLCHVQQTRLLFELREIANKLDNIYENFLHGTMSSDIIPLPILKEIFTRSSLEKGLVSASLPSTFYRSTSLSLLSVNKEKQSISVIFVAPRVERTPSYKQIKIHTVSSTVVINDIIFDRVLELDQEEFAMPMDLYDKKGEGMNLTAAEIHRLRVPLECLFTNGYYACRNFGNMGSELSLCLSAIFAHDGPKMMTHCDVRLIPQNRHHVVSTSSGATGVLISTISNYKILGEDLTRPLHYQREDLTKMAARSSKTSLCVWVGAHFTSILIQDDQGKIIEKINQDNRILVRNAFVPAITEFTDRHFSYYEREVDLPDGHSINFTGYYAEVLKNWKDITEVPRPHFHLKSHSNIFLFVAVAMATLILVLYLIKMVKCIRRRRKGPTVKESEDAMARMSIEDQPQPQTNRPATPTSTRSPPCKRRLNFDNMQTENERPNDRTFRKSVRESSRPTAVSASNLHDYIRFNPKTDTVVIHKDPNDPTLLGLNKESLPPRSPSPERLIPPRKGENLVKDPKERRGST